MLENMKRYCHDAMEEDFQLKHFAVKHSVFHRIRQSSPSTTDIEQSHFRIWTIVIVSVSISILLSTFCQK